MLVYKIVHEIARRNNDAAFSQAACRTQAEDDTQKKTRGLAFDLRFSLPCNPKRSFVKKDNPDAKLDGVKIESNGDNLITTKFGYKDFASPAEPPPAILSPTATNNIAWGEALRNPRFEPYEISSSPKVSHNAFSSSPLGDNEFFTA